MSLSFEEVLVRLNRFARERKVIESSFVSPAVKARLLAQHDSAVALFTASLEADSGDGGGTPQVDSSSGSTDGVVAPGGQSRGAKAAKP